MIARQSTLKLCCNKNIDGHHREQDIFPTTITLGDRFLSSTSMYRHRTQTTETTRKVLDDEVVDVSQERRTPLPHPNRQPCPIYPSDCPRSQVKMMKSNLANQTGRVWATPRQMSRHWGCGWMAGVQKGYGGLLAAEGRWVGRRREG